MSIFNETVEIAKNAADVTAKKAGEILDIAKANIKIADLKSSLEKAYIEIGKLVCDAAKSDTDNSLEINEQIIVVDEISNEINMINEQLIILRGLKKCPNCSKSNSKESVFCSSCGSEL